MRKHISAYIGAKNKLLKLLGCESDFPVRVLTDATWRIEESEGVSFLHYRHEGSDEELVSVIVNKDGKPWIATRNDTSLVIAIDCIRFAFILNNGLRTKTTEEGTNEERA